MQTLDLYIENRIRIDLNSVVFQDIFRKPYLVQVLDIHKFLLGFFILRVNLQLSDGRKIRNPVVSHMGGHPVCQKRISV